MKRAKQGYRISGCSLPVQTDARKCDRLHNILQQTITCNRPLTPSTRARCFSCMEKFEAEKNLRVKCDFYAVGCSSHG